MKFPGALAGPLALCFLWRSRRCRPTTRSQEIVVTASLARDQRGGSAAERDRARSATRCAAAGVQHFEDVLGPDSRPQLGRGNFAAALFPAPRHRRGRAVPGRAQPVRRLSDRRHRFLRCRHAGDAVRHSADRSAARAAGHGLRRQRAGGIDQRAHGGSRHRVRTQRAKSRAPITIRAPRASPSATASPEAAPAGAWLRSST